MDHFSKLKSKQRGATFFGMLFMAAVIGLLFIIGAKVVPTVIEYQAILKAANSAKTGTTVAEIRSTFDKTQTTGYFESISGKDLVIEKFGDKNVISFAYQKEIPLAGPVYLLLKYEGKTN
jgi:lipopolysaccharide export LptBFGC system permease protein LptF